mmetsp:Transcript_24290/g.68214  ORF Transcript_24290/g.68214 Transcript_24290/m.68214 type:complete len:236 (+) Transcript_24290:203-910(+)
MLEGVVVRVDLGESNCLCAPKLTCPIQGLARRRPAYRDATTSPIVQLDAPPSLVRPRDAQRVPPRRRRACRCCRHLLLVAAVLRPARPLCAIVVAGLRPSSGLAVSDWLLAQDHLGPRPATCLATRPEVGQLPDDGPPQRPPPRPRRGRPAEPPQLVGAEHLGVLAGVAGLQVLNSVTSLAHRDVRRMAAHAPNNGVGLARLRLLLTLAGCRRRQRPRGSVVLQRLGLVSGQQQR